MIKVTLDEAKLIQDVGRQYPRFLDLLSRWREHELESLVFAPKDFSDVVRGRVQSLSELLKAIKGSV